MILPKQSTVHSVRYILLLQNGWLFLPHHLELQDGGREKVYSTADRRGAAQSAGLLWAQAGAVEPIGFRVPQPQLLRSRVEVDKSLQREDGGSN